MEDMPTSIEIPLIYFETLREHLRWLLAISVSAMAGCTYLVIHKDFKLKRQTQLKVFVSLFFGSQLVLLLKVLNLLDALLDVLEYSHVIDQKIYITNQESAPSYVSYTNFIELKAETAAYIKGIVFGTVLIFFVFILSSKTEE